MHLRQGVRGHPAALRARSLPSPIIVLLTPRVQIECRDVQSLYAEMETRCMWWKGGSARVRARRSSTGRWVGQKGKTMPPASLNARTSRVQRRVQDFVHHCSHSAACPTLQSPHTVHLSALMLTLQAHSTPQIPPPPAASDEQPPQPLIHGHCAKSNSGNHMSSVICTLTALHLVVPLVPRLARAEELPAGSCKTRAEEREMRCCGGMTSRHRA